MKLWILVTLFFSIMLYLYGNTKTDLQEKYNQSEMILASLLYGGILSVVVCILVEIIVLIVAKF